MWRTPAPPPGPSVATGAAPRTSLGWGAGAWPWCFPRTTRGARLWVCLGSASFSLWDPSGCPPFLPFYGWIAVCCTQVLTVGQFYCGWTCGQLPVWSHHKSAAGTSLVAQWLRICLPGQGTQIQLPVRELRSCRLQRTKPMGRGYVCWILCSEIREGPRALQEDPVQSKINKLFKKKIKK